MNDITTETGLQPQVDLFRKNLPNKPYAANTKHCRITTLERALNKCYIQLNPPWRIAYLVFDVDWNGGGGAWYDAGLPWPLACVINRANGHAHIIYALRVPVAMHEHARQEPARYLEAIEYALTMAMRADPAFNMVNMAKNPLRSDAWQVNWGPNHAYELWEFSERLDLKQYQRQEAKTLCAIGRNVDTFDTVRTWSYKHVLGFKRDGASMDEWQAELHRQATYYTVQAANHGMHAIPLGDNELRHLAKSVAKWTWARFDLKAFSLLQTGRIRKRWGDSTARDAQIVQLVQEGTHTQQAIADRVGCSQQTVSNIVRMNGFRTDPAFRDASIVALKAEGRSVREIASHTQCSVGTVCNVLKAASVHFTNTISG